MFHVRCRRQVQLGPLRIEIRSNEEQFAGLRFFTADEPTEGALSDTGHNEPHFVLSLCNLRLDGSWSLEVLRARRDRSYRGGRMAAGYYLTDHFGEPAFLVTEGRHYWIFAEDFERILWPYAVKYLLTLYSLENNLVHLKAGGISIEGQGTLLIGRGGSGKTVLLSRLCEAGAGFLSNTHALIDGRTLVGVATSMRVRPDHLFGPLIAERHLSPSVKEGEYTVDPIADLGWSKTTSAPVRNVCIVDYKGPGVRILEEIAPQTTLEYIEQFALAMNVYGLKEDVLDYLGGDVARFSSAMSRVKSRLHALVERSRCHYMSYDLAHTRDVQPIWNMLSGKDSGPQRVSQAHGAD